MNRRHRTSQVALVLLAVGAFYQGLWAQFAPHSFYEGFPIGLGWVRDAGPYSEHLLRDVGGLVTGLGVLALAAAFVRTTPMLVTAAVAWLVYAVPHLVFHVMHPLPTTQGLEVVALTSQVVLPLIGLAAVRTKS